MSVRGKTLYAPTRDAISWPHPGDFPIGSVESRAAARASIDRVAIEERQALSSALANLSPLELAFSELAEKPAQKLMIVRMVRDVIVPRHQILGTYLPTPDEVRRMKKLSDVMAQIRKERGDHDRTNEATIRALAEERLRDHCDEPKSA